MAFSYGFFNSKGLDRTYTAENFCDYLGSIICNGILDTYGQKFNLRAGNGLSVILGTGKAWINGHYFINDAAYNIDLSNYMDESLPRYVGIAIVLNTADNVRNVSIEVTPGTPAESPRLPSYPADANKTRLLMYGVRMNPGATSLTERDWYDYREDKNVCGYCQCILGKCQVSELLFDMNTIKRLIREYNDTIADLTDKVETLQVKVDDLTGDIIDTGSVGDDVYYVLYSNGNLLLRGTGATYDYQLNGNRSPFFEDERIKRVVISEGITSIGDVFFERCQNLTDIVLPDSLESIGERSFFMYGSGGLTSLRIPSSVKTIKEKAFVDNSMTSVTLPGSLQTLGTYIFMECEHLQSARVECEEVPGFCFVRCSALRELTLSKKVKTLNSHMINYCPMSSEYNDRDRQSEDNCARLAAALLKRYGLGIDALFTHTHWLNVKDGKTGSVDQLNTMKNRYKNCPAYILPHWEQFKAKVAAYLGEGDSKPAPNPAPPAEKSLYRVHKSWADAKSQIGAYENLDNAKKACTSGYTVYDDTGRAIFTNAVKSYIKGAEVTLKSTTLYASAYAEEGKKRSGTYFLYDGMVVNGRMRITNEKKNCGNTPVGYYVTGWVNKADI